MTFSHFSKGFIRPNLGEESGCGYDKRKCENGNVKGVVSLQSVIAICTLSPVLCPNRKRPQQPVVQVIIQSSLVSWQEIWCKGTDISLYYKGVDCFFINILTL